MPGTWKMADGRRQKVEGRRQKAEGNRRHLIVPYDYTETRLCLKKSMTQHKCLPKIETSLTYKSYKGSTHFTQYNTIHYDTMSTLHFLIENCKYPSIINTKCT